MLDYIYGIDISNNNGSVTMSEVANDGVQYVYMKATEGINFKDSYMNGFYADAKSQGLKVGAYHFLVNSDGASQAQSFYNNIKDYSWDMYPMMDIETNFDGLCDVIKEFVVEWKTLTDMQLGVYTYTSFLDYLTDVEDIIKNFPFWQAQYNNDPWNLSDTFFANRIGHQYSETGSVSGVTTNCDLNYFTAGVLMKQKVVAKGTWKIDRNGWWLEYADQSNGKYPSKTWLYAPKSNSDTSGSWFYFDEKGYMITGWHYEYGNYYFLDKASGAMQIGWLYDQDENKWFYADSNGVMQKGWIQDKTNLKWYYLQEEKTDKYVEGEMRTGWININNKNYCLYSNGSMIHDTTEYGYSFDSNGVATKM